nr:hypothetical protein [uncultured Bacteroides sp.]
MNVPTINKKELDVTTLNINKGEYLSDALKRQDYNFLPSNAIINKVMTGTGATYMELSAKHSPRNSIVIEPFRSSIDDKVKIFSKSFGCFKEATVKQLETYMKRKNIPYKKIITTPEGFSSKVLNAAKNAGIDIYDYFCVYDECDHVTQDTGYRRSISEPMEEFFKFKEKALVSATPIKPSKYTINLFLRNGFKWIEVRPNFPYQEDLSLITTHSFNRRVREKVKDLLDAGSSHVCIFYKTTEGIKDIVENLKQNGIISDNEYKVFCSKKSADELKSKLLEHSSEKLELPLRKVNFFTSRFFPSIDINLTRLCDVMILSNYSYVKHTLIDPYSEAIQCQGRFRKIFENGKRFSSLTVISSIPNDLMVKSPEDIDTDICTRIKSYRAVKSQKSKAKKPPEIESYNKELKNMRINNILNPKSGKIDRFAIEQMINEERVKSYYLSPDALRKAYENTNYFNVNFAPDDEIVGEDDLFKLNSATRQEKLKLIVNTLDMIGSDKDALQLLKSKCVEEEWLIKAFSALGRSVIEENKCNKTKIEKLLHKAEIEEGKLKRFSPEFMKDIRSEFSKETGQDIYIEVKDILDRIAYLFNAHGITYSRYREGKSSKDVMCKLNAEMIKDYFDIKSSNRKGVATVKLNKFKEEQVRNSSIP